jgi:integrase
VARIRYLTVAEAERLLNARDPESARGELITLEVCDYNPDANTLAIRQSKSGKPRHVVLTDEGAAFFRDHCAGRNGHELMFRHGDGSAWQRSEQTRPMAEACERARIKPAISFHILRRCRQKHVIFQLIIKLISTLPILSPTVNGPGERLPVHHAFRLARLHSLDSGDRGDHV